MSATSRDAEIAELVKRGRYLEALEAIARDRLLASLVAKTYPVFARALAFYAIVSEGASPARVAELLKRIGVEPGEELRIAEAIREGRLAELAKKGGLVGEIAAVAAGLTTPEKAVEVVKRLAARNPGAAAAVAVYYIYNVLRRGGRVDVRGLAMVAEAAGLKHLAERLVELERLPAEALAKAILEHFEELVKKGIIKTPQIEALERLSKMLEEFVKRVEEAVKLAEPGTAEAYARAAEALARLEPEAERILREAERLGLKLELAKPIDLARGFAAAALIAAVVEGGLSALKRMAERLARLLPSDVVSAIKAIPEKLSMSDVYVILSCLLPGFKPVHVGARRARIPLM